MIFLMMIYINSPTDIKKILSRCHLPKNNDEVNDYNAYERTNAHDIIEKISQKTIDYIRKKWNSLTLNKFLDTHKDKLYGHDLSYLHEYYNDVGYIGLFEVYQEGGKNKLKLSRVLMITQSKSYVFESDQEEWSVIRILYINIVRSFSSLTYHQLCANIYLPNILYLVRTTISPNHPIHILLNPFFEGVYNTNNIFNSYGIGLYNQTNFAMRAYMERTQIFDIR
jgi:hypothetical protein